MIMYHGWSRVADVQLQIQDGDDLSDVVCHLTRSYIGYDNDPFLLSIL